MKKAVFIQAVFLVFILPLPSSAQDRLCIGEQPSLVVSAENQTLHLCNGKILFNSYPISVGKAGWDKRKQGDNRTPVGLYSIGAPRSSKKFHIFIPMGYPTKEQQQKGYTGNAIGIHGPWQPLRWLGRLNNIINWTQGCIAVGRNSDIEDISEWVRKYQPRQISIE